MTAERIEEPHALFAQALIALAREHGVGKVSCSFRLSVGFDRPNGWNAADVTATWAEGRHGATEDISLSATVTAFLRETVRAPFHDR